MFRRPYYVALALVLLLIAVLLSLPERVSNKVKLIVGTLFVPMFGVVGTAQSWVEQVSSSTTPRRLLAQQIEQLQRENQQLRLRQVQTDEALRENARLRQIVGWRAQAAWKFRAARVIGRDTANWWRTVRIDAGKSEGLRPGLPVMSPEGLIGKVGEVGLGTAEVVLIGDPKCRVAVVVRETGEQGILSSSSAGVLDHRWVDLTHLPRTTQLKPGQTVFTSGLGGVFPPGLAVGSVVDSRTMGYGLMTEARVKLVADSSHLQEVMVLLP